MASAQTLQPVEQTTMLSTAAAAAAVAAAAAKADLPRIDLEKIDNIPYYIESTIKNFFCLFCYIDFLFVACQIIEKLSKT